MNVTDDADDGGPGLVIVSAAELNSFAQRILARKDLASCHFADDCHSIVSCGVGLGKQAAA